MMHLLFTNMQLFISQYINWCTGVVWITCGLLWCFYQLFGLSFWRHPFTAEDPLVSKWCNATFLKIWTHKETNSTSWMAWVCVNVQPIIIFGWTIPFTKEFEKKSNLLKGIVHPKMKVLSSFTQPKLVPNLYKCLCSAEHKGRYFEESL